MWPRDAIAEGWVMHRRTGPTPHAFRYRVNWLLADIEDLPVLARRSRLWSVGRRTLVSFRRADYLPGEPGALADAVRDLVSRHAGRRPTGRVLILSQPRQWGVCFNPVSFYFALDPAGGLQAIVAEITNTPWDERHRYVLPVAAAHAHDGRWRFDFGKDFHVSPFLPMDLDYSWEFVLQPVADSAADDGTRLDIRMRAARGGTPCFFAAMHLGLRPATGSALTRFPFRQPLATTRTLARIYWQAFRLWLKRTPFYPHPDTLDEDVTQHGKT